MGVAGDRDHLHRALGIRPPAAPDKAQIDLKSGAAMPKKLYARGHPPQDRAMSGLLRVSGFAALTEFQGLQERDRRVQDLHEAPLSIQ